MTLILGIDPATRTGFAIYDDDKPPSAIRAWSVTLKGGSDELKAAQAGAVLVDVIQEYRPDFVAIEAPLKNVVQHKKRSQTMFGEETSSTINPASVILPCLITGAFLGNVGGFGLPWTTIPVSTWRKQFHGSGRRPGWKRDDWKKAARQRCDQLRISVKNDDAAEAVGVAFAAPSTDVFKMYLNRVEAA